MGQNVVIQLNLIPTAGFTLACHHYHGRSYETTFDGNHGISNDLKIQLDDFWTLRLYLVFAIFFVKNIPPLCLYYNNDRLVKQYNDGFKKFISWYAQDYIAH